MNWNDYIRKNRIRLLLSEPYIYPILEGSRIHKVSFQSKIGISVSLFNHNREYHLWKFFNPRDSVFYWRFNEAGKQKYYYSKNTDSLYKIIDLYNWENLND